MTPWLYFRCPIDAQRQANLLGIAPGLALTALCHYSDEDGNCYPSQLAIADFTGLSDRAIRKATLILERAGLIAVGRSTGLVSRYAIPSIAALSTTTTNEEPRSGVSRPPRNHVPETPEPRSGGPRNDVPPELEPKNENQEREKGAPPIEAFIERWNAIQGVSHCLKATDTRKRHYQARAGNPDWIKNVVAALAKLAASAFCCGDNDRGWHADIDWFLRPDTATKLLEGKYDNRNGNGQPGAVPTSRPVVFHADGRMER